MLAAIAAANKDFVDANLTNVFKYVTIPRRIPGCLFVGWEPSGTAPA